MARAAKRQKNNAKSEKISVQKAVKFKCELDSCMSVAAGYGRMLEEELRHSFPRYIEQEFRIYEKMLEHSIHHSAQTSVNCELLENVTASISESLMMFASPAAGRLKTPISQHKLTPIKVVDLDFFKHGFKFATTQKVNVNENISTCKNINKNKMLATIKESFEESCRVKLTPESNFKSVNGSVAEALLNENGEADSVLKSFAKDFEIAKTKLQTIKQPQTFKSNLKKAKNPQINTNLTRERMEKARSRKEEALKKIKTNMNSKTNLRLEANAKRREVIVKKTDQSSVFNKLQKGENASKLAKPQIFFNESGNNKKATMTTSTPFIGNQSDKENANRTIECGSNETSNVKKSKSLRNQHNSTAYSYDKDYDITTLKAFDVTPSDDWYEFEGRIAEKAPKWACKKNVESKVKAQFENPSVQGDEIFGMGAIDLKPLSRMINDNRKRKNFNKSL